MTKTLLALALASAIALPIGVHAAVKEPTDIGPVAIEKKDSPLPENWHRKGVFMEIYVRGYQDSGKDGKGDLKGLISRLDYLKDLGISGIWLMPITESQDHDHGYAVKNYRNIEPHYGNLEDFDMLIAEAHKRGIGVIMDYVINHSANAHPLFDNTLEGPKAKYRNWYVFSDEKPEGWNTFSGDPWHPWQHGYYYAAFVDSLPDFNLKNPDVIDFHMNNLKFWLNRGIDGFRFDAVGVLVENDSIGWENQPENHKIMHNVRKLLDEYGNKFMVCEAPTDAVGFSAPDSCGSAFAFGLQKHIIKTVKFGRVSDEMTSYLEKNPVGRMSTILSNHDAFAGVRLFNQFNGNEKEYKMAVATLLTLPGRPFLYYGEEIGISNTPEQNYEDQEIRPPMSWNNSKSAGFSESRRLFRPNAENWETHNVEVESKDPNSFLNYYKGLIALRTNNPTLSEGDYVRVPFKDQSVLAFMRSLNGKRSLVILNYSEKPVKGSLKLAKATTASAIYPQATATGKITKNQFKFNAEPLSVQVFNIE